MRDRKSRVEQAAATRARVVRKALELFLAQGYAATSTRQIAEAAGVTERTLFNIVPSKSELLRQVVLAHVFTQDYGPLLERKDFAATLHSASVVEFLSEFTRWVTRLHGSTAPIAEMVRQAAAVDTGAAELWRWGDKQQVTDCRNLVGLLRNRGWLQAGLTAGETADSLALLSGHETYWRLVTERHWSHQRYRRWLHRHCALELIGLDATRGPRELQRNSPQ
jgi:AcrR family transcriptional regulator